MKCSVVFVRVCCEFLARNKFSLQNIDVGSYNYRVASVHRTTATHELYDIVKDPVYNVPMSTFTPKSLWWCLWLHFYMYRL